MNPRVFVTPPGLPFAFFVVAGLAGQTVVLPEPPDVLESMEQRNAARQETLPAYEGIRRYAAGNARLGKHAEAIVVFRFDPPATRSLEVMERSGSGIVHRMVIDPILGAERTVAGKNGKRDVDICRRNYQFEYAGYDSERRAWVFVANPKTAHKYLFRGRIWIDEDDFGIRRIEGQPAGSPSYWVKRTSFVHEYERREGYWLPVHHESVAELRVFGRSTLTIDYSEYKLKRPAIVSALTRDQ